MYYMSMCISHCVAALYAHNEAIELSVSNTVYYYSFPYIRADLRTGRFGRPAANSAAVGRSASLSFLAPAFRRPCKEHRAKPML